VACKDLCFSLGAVDLGEDLVGVLDPGERLGVLVAGIDEGADRGGELLDGAEGPQRMAWRVMIQRTPAILYRNQLDLDV
jgi:hypothetical protein